MCEGIRTYRTLQRQFQGIRINFPILKWLQFEDQKIVLLSHIHLSSSIFILSNNMGRFRRKLQSVKSAIELSEINCFGISPIVALIRRVHRTTSEGGLLLQPTSQDSSRSIWKPLSSLPLASLN